MALLEDPPRPSPGAEEQPKEGVSCLAMYFSSLWKSVDVIKDVALSLQVYCI